MVLKKFRKDRLSRGVAIGFAFTVFNFSMAIFASVIAARYLGPVGVGMLAIGFMVIEFAAIVENLPYPGFVRDYSLSANKRKLSTVVSITLAINTLATVVLLVLSIPLAKLLGVPAVLLQVFAFIPVLSTVNACTVMYYEARREMTYRNLPLALESAGRLAFYAAFVYLMVATATPDERKLEVIVYCTVAALAVSMLFTSLFAPSLKLKHFDRRKARYYLKFGSRTQTVQFLSKVILWFGVIMVAFTWGFETMGYYKIAFSTMFYIIVFQTAITFILYPTLSRAHKKDKNRGVLGGGGKNENDIGGIRGKYGHRKYAHGISSGAKKNGHDVEKYFSIGLFYSLAIAIPLSAVLFVFPDFITRTLYGQGFAESAWMVRWLAPVAVLCAFVLPVESLLPAVNRPGLLLQLAIVEVSVNIVLNILLVPRIGVTGTIIALWATYLVGILYGYYLYFRLGYGRPSLSHVKNVLTRVYEIIEKTVEKCVLPLFQN